MEFQQLIKEEILPYDTDRYPLKDVIAKILECEDRPLQELHETIPGSEDAAILTLAHDQCLVFHRMYYQSPLMYKVRARDPATHTRKRTPAIVRWMHHCLASVVLRVTSHSLSLHMVV